MLKTVFIFYLFSFIQVVGQNIDVQINDLLKKMTLEEKVGQMTQITLEVVSKPRQDGSFINEIDPVKLKEALTKYHVGSILNTGGQANTLQNWIEMITTIQDVALKETRTAVPVIYGIDAIHGATYTKDATLFPQSIAMAATFNTELVKTSGIITALEVRASGIPWNFNPVLGVGRNPVWSRFWETFGEDPYVVSQMGEAYIKGLEGDDNNTKGEFVAACMKHYMGYSNPVSGKDRTPAWIPERMLRDIFLPPFKKAVDAGVHTVMINSGEINGIPTHSDHYILTEILKNELGFKGFAVSDWEDIKRLYTRDKVADSPEEAVRMAVMAGVDMSMIPYDYSFYEILVKLVKEGKVPVSRIDDAVRRILWVKIKTGLFKNPYPDKKLTSKFASAKSQKANLDAAREAITLLKNNKNILPLNKKSKVLVAGPTANKLSVMNGGWTITWQGDREDLYPQEKLTILEAIENKIGKSQTKFVQGADFDTLINIDKALEQAKNSDVVVLCLGEPTYCETPGNIMDLTISQSQLDLANAFYKSGKPVILVLVEGRPRVINKIVKNASGIIMAYLPGMEGGQAIADVIFGDTNPSGKLPFTYPIGPNGFTTYDHKPIENFEGNGYANEFPFGYGLSYTKFEYSDLKIDRASIKMDEEISISVVVKNSGSLAGKEAVLLYGSDLFSSVSQPAKQLKRFSKISLKPGEVKTVQFKLNAKDFAFTNRDNKKVTEPGAFKLMVGGLQKEFNISN